MYVCGMTIQNKPHVGHIRASLSAEVMRRHLEHLGYEVSYVQLHRRGRQDHRACERRGYRLRRRERAQHRGLPPVRRPAQHQARDRVPARATQHISGDARVIHRLIEKGHALRGRRRRLFDVRSRADYGKLSGPPRGRTARGLPDRAGRGEARPARLRALEGRQAGRAGVGEPVGGRGARLAHRVLGHGDEAPRRDDRHPRRRAGPDLPAPRERAGAERGRARASRSRTTGPRTAS